MREPTLEELAEDVEAFAEQGLSNCAYYTVTVGDSSVKSYISDITDLAIAAITGEDDALSFQEPARPDVLRMVTEQIEGLLDYVTEQYNMEDFARGTADGLRELVDPWQRLRAG